MKRDIMKEIEEANAKHEERMANRRTFYGTYDKDIEYAVLDHVELEYCEKKEEWVFRSYLYPIVNRKPVTTDTILFDLFANIDHLMGLQRVMGAHGMKSLHELNTIPVNIYWDENGIIEGWALMTPKEALEFHGYTYKEV